MKPTLSSSLNRTVLVCIPSLFADTEARPCRIVAAEAFGLWLFSDELSQRLLADGKHDKDAAAQAIFVPFAQIAAIVPLVQKSVATGGLKAAASVQATPATTKPRRTKSR